MDLTNLNKDRKNRRKPSLDLSTMVYGKVPPQAKELEEAVLGGIMLEKQAFATVIEILQPECFYVDAHQRVYKTFISLSNKQLPIDILTVVEELKYSEELDIVGGPYAVTRLTNNVISTANIEAHARIILQKFLSREVIRIGGEMITDAYEDSTDVFDLIDNVEHKVSGLSINTQSKPYTSLQEVAEKALMNIAEMRLSKDELTGVPSGIPQVDVITQGWQPTDLIVCGARPGVGKTALAANLGYNAALHPTKPTPVGIFSLEMGTIQWVVRMLASAAEIDRWNIKRGRISDAEMRKLENVVYETFKNAKIFFDDSSSLDIYQLKSKARRMVTKEGVGLIIIDYLQLMNGLRSQGETREQEISKISRELKQLAKELNVPIIALSQLSRKGEGTEPRLSDLRESGAIEQDADVVLFLIPVTDDDVAKDASLKDSILVKIAKHRDGIVEKIPIKFVKEIQKIMSESAYDRYMTNRLTQPTSTGTDTRQQFDEGFEAAPF